MTINHLYFNSFSLVIQFLSFVTYFSNALLSNLSLFLVFFRPRVFGLFESFFGLTELDFTSHGLVVSVEVTYTCCWAMSLHIYQCTHWFVMRITWVPSSKQIDTCSSTLSPFLSSEFLEPKIKGEIWACAALNHSKMEIKIQKYRIGLVKMNKFLPIEFSTDWISGIRSQISLFFFMTQD